MGHGSAYAQQGLVPCGQTPQNPCQLSDVGRLALNIFNLVVFRIAIPLAVIAVVAGGIMILLQGFNANFLAIGKGLIWAAVIGIAIIFLSWVIVNAIFTTLGAPPLNPNP